ncbi:MAG: hypothetical protein Q6K99_02635 [Thermostichales cyanobacterium BF4_bins_65]
MFGRGLKLAVVGLVSLGSVGMAEVARADAWEEQVRAQLAIAGMAAVARGFELTHSPFLGSLPHNTREDVTLNLRAGVSYAIIAVCDEDCTDLDLELYDPQGRLVDSDYEPADIAGVVVRPTASGRYRVRVLMSSCVDSPCRYGIGAFGN